MEARRFSLIDKVAIVTGSGMGIGEGIALGFADMGADVVVAERDAESAEATAAEIRSRGRNSIVVLSDVREQEQVDDALQHVGAPAAECEPADEKGEDQQHRLGAGQPQMHVAPGDHADEQHRGDGETDRR